MKILMLTPYLPYPPSSGGQIRSYNLIKQLAKKHEIYLVCLIKNKNELKNMNMLTKYVKKIYPCYKSATPWTISNIVKSIFGFIPFLIVRNHSSQAKDAILKQLQMEQIDLIHAETFYVMPHIPKTNLPILLVEQTIEYKVYQHFVDNLKIPFIKYLFQPEIFKLKRWELKYWKEADLTCAVSEDDKKVMLSSLPNLKVEIVPNAAGEDMVNLYAKKTANFKHPIFFFPGNFLWMQNVEAAESLSNVVFPIIKEHLPNAECIIAGQHAHTKLKNINNKDITIIDIDPSDISIVQDLYNKATVFISPISGPGGTRLKILAAMASGLPVISSETGVSGLDVIHKKHVFIAKTVDDYAKYALEIIENKQLYEKMKRNARKLVEEKYSWPTIATHLEKMYSNLIKGYENRN